MSTEQTTFLDMLLDTTNFLRTASSNASIDKEELCKSMENRLSVMISKMVSAPMGGSFSVFNRDSQQCLDLHDHP